MKHYRATPIRGTPGDPIVANGMRALYSAAHDAWGMLAQYPSVRNNMLPTGRVYKTRDGWIEITHAPDADEAALLAEQNAVSDAEVDYMADVYVTSKGQPTKGDEVEYVERRLRARGLFNLLKAASDIAAVKMRGEMPNMSEDALRTRLPNARAQMSKSRAIGKPVYSMPFPTIQEGYWKSPKYPLDYRVYVDIAAIYEAPPQRGFVRRD